MAYYLCGHNGSGNHSNEDRIRGSCRLMAEPPLVVTSNPEEELHYGIARLAGICNVMPQLHPDDRCLTHCAESAEHLRKLGGTPVLWGWSGAGMSRQLARKLASFDTLVVSEQQSVFALQDAGLMKKTRLGPDLSFLVERQLRPLQGNFREDTLGLCLSLPSGQDELLYKSYERLLRHIMTQTRFQVALIPYCVHRSRDDTLLHITLEQRFRGWCRVICRPDGTCQELRGDLSLCRLVIGCEGAVAAWSCGVPALCIGATPRATGLAKELFNSWEDAVVPFSALTDTEELTRRFRRFLRREDKLRRQLEVSVPLRRHQALQWQW